MKEATIQLPEEAVPIVEGGTYLLKLSNELPTEEIEGLAKALGDFVKKTCPTTRIMILTADFELYRVDD